MTEIQVITSPDNPKLKHIRKLIDDKEYRYEHQEYIIEGYKVFEFAKNIRTIIVREGAKIPLHSGNPMLISIPETIFKKITDTQTSQGVLGICSMVLEKEILKTKNYIYLDKLQDPGNMGTIMRTAVGFGFEGIILSKGCVDPFMPKVVRATMGALFKLKLILLENTKSLAEYNVIVADLAGKNIKTMDKSAPCILAIGNESNGISPELKNIAKQVISIPTTKNIESLNASISAAILMYEIANK